MIINTVRRIMKEDLSRSGEALPKWLDSLLSPLNEFIDRVTTILRQNITFKDNIQGKLVSVSLTHNTALKISSGSTTPVNGVIPLYFDGEAMDSFGWTRNTDGSVTVTIKFVAGSGTVATCSLFILYGP